MVRNAYEAALDACKDAERAWIEDGSERAKAEAPRNECPCCVAYARPGMIWNAGAWIRCPMCNPAQS